MDACILRGVRTHNLKGIDLSIPFGRLTVVTGVSGSGKSSLAFDTIYAEGQRRFVDCLATYARQFLERLDRPDAEFIGHLEPPIALKQTIAVRNARSTVGTMSEVNDYLQLLFAHAGEIHCVSCGERIEIGTIDSAVARILAFPQETRIVLSAPIARDHLDADGIGGLLRQGYVRTVHEGAVREWPEPWLVGDRTGLPEEIEVVVDRFPRRAARRARVAEAVEGAWRLGHGRALLSVLGEEGAAARRVDVLRRGPVCAACGTVGETPVPALFSANSPLGACPACQGFGRVITIDREKVVPDRRRTLRNDAVLPFAMPSNRPWYRRMLRSAGEAEVRTETPWSELTERERVWVFEGSGRYRGVNGLFARLERKRYKMHVRVLLARFRGYIRCETCNGSRLTPAALAVRIGGRDLGSIGDTPIRDVRAFFTELQLPTEREKRVRAVLREVRSRLRMLDEVGLGYLTLSRPARTLSGGETQRLRLSGGMGSNLTRTLYILDEPTVGLHARDASRVLKVLRAMCRAGNTVLVVEHDPTVIRGADHLIVLGPEGGEQGGELLYEGSPGVFLRKDPTFFRVGAVAREPSPRLPASALRLRGLRANNLHIDALEIPLRGIVAVSGVSGSGKSTLLDEVIHRNWRRHRGLPVEDVGAVRAIEGFDALEEIVLVGQDPLGRSTRSNAVSFVKVSSLIRDLLARTPAASARGLAPRDFSFNVAGGRCETCKGLGTVVLEMHFLPDVEVACDDCKGRRFRSDVLEVAYRGRTILNILEMTTDDASRFFAESPEIVRRLRPLQEVGLGYLRLGQPTSTLSGGEAQRLKLASFLVDGPTEGRRLFLFDEPTTGLHARDVSRLLSALRALNARGDTALVVEHHLDFLAASDWIIDLGPGAGDDGGKVVYSGPVHGILKAKDSITRGALASRLRGRA